MTCGYTSMRRNSILQLNQLPKQTLDHKMGPQALCIHVTISLTTTELVLVSISALQGVVPSNVFIVKN